MHWKKISQNFLTPHIQTIKITGWIAIVVMGLSIWLIVSHQIFLTFIGLSYKDYNPLHFLGYGLMAWGHGSLFTKWLVSLFLPVGIIGALVFVALLGHQKTLFGNAHWASRREAKKAGLFIADGLIIGKKWNAYLRVGGFEHIFIFAPSGSGKTNALVAPNLFQWNGSCIVQDVKLTLFNLTSKFRQTHGQLCFVWNPGARDFATHAYNPLDFVSKNKILRIDDLQKMAHILIPDRLDQDPIWTAQPRTLFVALALYLLDTDDRPKTLGEISRIVKNTPNLSSWVNNLLSERHDLDALCYRNFNTFLQMEYRLQTNIIQSFLSYFELFDNPIVDAATSRSDFDLKQLRKEKMTIYVGVGSDNLVRLSPLLTVFYQQALDVLLRELPDPNTDPHSVLFLLDEFSALKRMENLQKNIGLLREYRVRIMAIIQDLPQLYVTYGHDGAKAFINNKIRIAFAQNDLDAATLVSGWLGYCTVEQHTQNRNTAFSDFSGSESRSYIKRELLQPSEIMQLEKTKEIVLIEGSPPILANKSFWYEDETLKSQCMGAIALPKIEPTMIPFDRTVLKKSAPKIAEIKDEDDKEEALCEENKY